MLDIDVPVVYAGRADLYLGKVDAETEELSRALTFDTREAAEAHRRGLRRPYDCYGELGLIRERRVEAIQNRSEH